MDHKTDPGVETFIFIPNKGWTFMTLTFRESLKLMKLMK